MTAFWTQITELAGGSRGHIVRALTDAWRDEVRLAVQLRQHAQSVPYENYATPLRDLASRAQARAGEIAGEITRQGASLGDGEDRPPRTGRNYWQRLTFDLEDLQALARRYRELANHFDVEYPEPAALFDRLSRDSMVMGRVITRLIALSDPHAAD
jgi:hypothetical protein